MRENIQNLYLSNVGSQYVKWCTSPSKLSDYGEVSCSKCFKDDIQLEHTKIKVITKLHVKPQFTDTDYFSFNIQGGRKLCR